MKKQKNNALMLGLIFSCMNLNSIFANNRQQTSEYGNHNDTVMIIRTVGEAFQVVFQAIGSVDWGIVCSCCGNDVNERNERRQEEHMLSMNARQRSNQTSSKNELNSDSQVQERSLELPEEELSEEIIDQITQNHEKRTLKKTISVMVVKKSSLNRRSNTLPIISSQENMLNGEVKD